MFSVRDEHQDEGNDNMMLSRAVVATVTLFISIQGLYAQDDVLREKWSYVVGRRLGKELREGHRDSPILDIDKVLEAAKEAYLGQPCRLSDEEMSNVYIAGSRRSVQDKLAAKKNRDREEAERMAREIQRKREAGAGLDEPARELKPAENK